MSKPKKENIAKAKKQANGLVSIRGSTLAAVGELHQMAGGEHPSLKANPRVPTLLEDFVLREKITHFDHERIPNASFMRGERERMDSSS
jgi:catalase